MSISVDTKRLKLTNEAGTEGALLGFCCRDCGVCIFGPAAFCQGCTSDNLEPVELSKRGFLYSYTVVRVPPSGWPGQVPYVLGQAELPEGLQVLAEVIDCPEAGLKIGMPLELALRTVSAAEGDPGKVVYKWRPTPTQEEGGP